MLDYDTHKIMSSFCPRQRLTEIQHKGIYRYYTTLGLLCVFSVNIVAGIFPSLFELRFFGWPTQQERKREREGYMQKTKNVNQIKHMQTRAESAHKKDGRRCV